MLEKIKWVIIIVLVIVVIVLSFFLIKEHKTPKKEIEVQKNVIEKETIFADAKLDKQIDNKGVILNTFPDFTPPKGFVLEGAYELIHTISQEGITEIKFYSHSRKIYILKKPDELIRSTTQGKKGMMYVIVTNDTAQNHLFLIYY